MRWLVDVIPQEVERISHNAVLLSRHPASPPCFGYRASSGSGL